MKRGGPLARRTPLRSKPQARTTSAAELVVERDQAYLEAAAAALGNRERSRVAPRPDTGPLPPVSKATRRPPSGFPPVVRQTILDRDRYACVRCGAHIDTGSHGYSLQHRIARGMGGTDDPAINRPANGIVLCGSATTGCHGRVESMAVEAARNGWAVEGWADPTSVPVKTPAGWVLLNDRGFAHPTTEPPNGDAHAVAQRRVRSK